LSIAIGLFFLSVGTSTDAYALDRFQDNRDGTVRDNATDLVWIKDPTKVPALKNGLHWVQAVDACRNLSYAGFGPTNWRLPSIKELQTLVSENRGSPRIDRMFKAINAPYWSSTTYVGQGARAWTVDFKNGELGSYPKLSLLKPSKLFARCVRSKR